VARADHGVAVIALTDANTSGDLVALTVLTPIIPGQDAPLREHLEGLSQEHSPLADIPGTHFGRWVIAPNFVSDPEQPKHDDLPCPSLLFSATLDGPLDGYLDALCLAPAAEQIWSHCIGCPCPARGPELKAYLLHNRIDTGLFFTAYPEASVEKVRRSLTVREKTIAFAVKAQQMEPAELKAAFIEEFDV
jgi:hypothetical protein